MTPRAAFESRDKAAPATRTHALTRELRVRHDKIDQHGAVTIHYKSKLHHIGMGRALKGRRLILLVRAAMSGCCPRMANYWALDPQSQPRLSVPDDGLRCPL
jgi:hypothetical protein